jgi:tRNA(adenine34) deaminase
MNEDEKWMKVALNQALKAKAEGEVPVGAVIVQNQKLIAKAFNQPISKNDPTAHAEIQALRKAGKKLENYRLVDTILYVTLEPCSMCLGAIIHARCARIVFGAYDIKTGACSSCKALKNINYTKQMPIITGGILKNQCKEILQKFFKVKRNKNSSKS